MVLGGYLKENLEEDLKWDLEGESGGRLGLGDRVAAFGATFTAYSFGQNGQRAFFVPFIKPAKSQGDFDIFLPVE